MLHEADIVCRLVLFFVSLLLIIIDTSCMNLVQLVNSILLIILKYAELHFVRNGALLRDLFGVPGGDDDPPVFVA